MPYEVLALKYRPKVFEDLVGQEAVTRTLTHAIQQNRIAHAFLFSGVRGVGKTTTARILAKALNCQSGPTVRPCGECAPCLEIARGSSLDVLEIDGASNNGVAEVRDIIEASRYAPSRDRYKIYIIDEVHMLSISAFNALLKTLEEPPPSVKFIFATTEYHKIPDTILSRCQEFEFRTVSPPEIAQQLRHISDSEGIRVSDGALAIVARAAEGSLRDGISALDQVIAASGTDVDDKAVTEILGLIERDVLARTARAIVERDTEAILRIVNELVRGGRDLRAFTSGLMQYLRDVLVMRVAPRAQDLLEVPGETVDLEAFARELAEEDLLRSLDVLTEAETGLRTSPEPRFHLEIALLKISQLRRLVSFEELLARFEALASGSPPPVPSTSGSSSSSGSGSGSRTGLSRARPEATSGSAPSSPRRENARLFEANARETKPGESGPPDPVSPAPSVSSESPDESDVPEAADAFEGPFDAPLVERLAERLKKTRPMLHAIVSRSHRAELERNVLRLVFLSSERVVAERLQLKDQKIVVEEQLSELAGRSLAIAVEVMDAAPPEATAAPSGPGDAGANGRAGPAEPTELTAPTEPTEPTAPTSEVDAGDDLRDRARKDPLVQRFVQTFQGEVEEIRSSRAERGT
jgi:DNA polymerase III subunit gamma/tau